MKGLLLKDFYMVGKYCRFIMIFVIGFTLISQFQPANTFFFAYPAIMCSIIPVTLISYDERSKWNVYSDTLPYTRAHTVSVKYIVGLICEAAAIVFTVIARFVTMTVSGSFNISLLLSSVLTMLFIGCVLLALILPVIFRFGAEKGRIAYYFVIGFMSAAAVAVMNLVEFDSLALDGTLIIVLLSVGGAALYLLSWLLSIRFYSKREL